MKQVEDRTGVGDMYSDEQIARLEAEKAALDELDRASTILEVESFGEPPNRYRLSFNGRGVCRSSSIDVDVEFLDKHECEIRLPREYPTKAPDIRWLSSIYHPNISFSGFITLSDLGLEWDESIRLDVVCEQLWDLVRMARYDLEQATNHSASLWFEKDSTLRLPLDQRPLRDKKRPEASNVIRYQRKGDQPIEIESNPNEEPIEAEVFFIGDETVPPVAKPQVKSLPPVRPTRRDSESDDDIFFIGD